MKSLLVPPAPMAAHDPCRLPDQDQEQPVVHASQKLVTVAIVAGPVVGLAVIIPTLWGHAVHLSDLLIGLVLYLITGFGITVGSDTKAWAMLTPKGRSVRSFILAISSRTASSSPDDVSMIPMAPALETAEARAERAIHPIGACTMGMSTPSSSVTRLVSTPAS